MAIIKNKGKRDFMDVGRLFVVNILLLIFLSACTEDNHNHGYGYSVDATDEDTGITVQFFNVPSFDIKPLADVYLEVRNCMTMYAPGPSIVVVDNREDIHYDVENINGVFLTNPPLIVVTDEPLTHYEYYILKHEFIHYLLWVNGFSDEDNRAHNFDFFVSCT